MLFRAVHFAVRRFGLAAALALGLPAVAQDIIQFSKPVSTDPAGKANAFMPATARHDPGSFNAPSPMFGGKDPSANFDVLPGSPQPVLSPAAAAQWQRLLNNQKNWALMTPEEILGVPTSEQILGIKDPNDNPDLSDEERYLQRQDRQSAIGASNALRRADSLVWHGDNDLNDPAHNVFQSPDGSAPFAAALKGMVPGPDRNGQLNPLANRPAGSLPGSNPKPVSLWVSPFDTPAPLPKPTPDQLAGMDRFRAMMEPPTTAKSPAASVFAIQPAPAPDPNMQVLPLVNPAGHSFAALQNDTARPTGLMPLPGVTGAITPPKKAASLTQPPPWLQDPLQNSSMPQRQY